MAHMAQIPKFNVFERSGIACYPDFGYRLKKERKRGSYVSLGE